MSNSKSIGEGKRVNFFYKLILTVNWIEVIIVWLVVLFFILALFSFSGGIPPTVSQRSSPNWIVIILWTVVSGAVGWFFTWMGLKLINGIKSFEHWVFTVLTIKNLLFIPLLAAIVLWVIEFILDINTNYSTALVIAAALDSLILFGLLYGYRIVYKSQHPDLGPYVQPKK